MTEVTAAGSWRRPSAVAVGIAVLSLLVSWSLIWPLVRLPLHLPINPNEGWNALHAVRAMNGGKLYPGADDFFFNNYPPLSFYLVGLAGAALGDDIIAGRAISLLAILAIGFNISLIVRHLGGRRDAGIFAGLLFVGTMCKGFAGYAGMNDPQLLGQAVMSAGFAMFTAAPQRRRNLVAAAVVMVLAGFIKHNIIALPLAATTWLVTQDRARFAVWVSLSAALVIAGFLVCMLLYGWNFPLQLLSPREISIGRILALSPGLWVFIPPLLLGTVFVAPRIGDPQTAMAGHLLVAGALAYLATQGGAGVSVNSMFDWVMAACIATGMAISRIGEICPARRLVQPVAQSLAVAALCLWLAVLPQKQPISNFQGSEVQSVDDLAFMRLQSGPTLCEDLAYCYWSGHDSAYVPFRGLMPFPGGPRPIEDLARRVHDGNFRLLVLTPGSPMLSAAEQAGIYRRRDTVAGFTIFYR